MLKVEIHFKGYVSVYDTETLQGFEFSSGQSDLDVHIDFPDEREWPQRVPAWLAHRRREFFEAFTEAQRPRSPPPTKRTIEVSFDSRGDAHVSDPGDPSHKFTFATRCDARGTRTVEVPSEWEWPACVPEWLATRRSACLEQLKQCFLEVKIVSGWTPPS